MNQKQWVKTKRKRTLSLCKNCRVILTRNRICQRCRERSNEYNPE